MILDPADPTVRRWLDDHPGAERRREFAVRREEEALQRALERQQAAAARRQAIRRQQVRAARKVSKRPPVGVYATATKRPIRYWQEVLRQSAARRRLDKQLLTLAG